MRLVELRIAVFEVSAMNDVCIVQGVSLCQSQILTKTFVLLIRTWYLVVYLLWQFLVQDAELMKQINKYEKSTKRLPERGLRRSLIFVAVNFNVLWGGFCIPGILWCMYARMCSHIYIYIYI